MSFYYANFHWALICAGQCWPVWPILKPRSISSFSKKCENDTFLTLQKMQKCKNLNAKISCQDQIREIAVYIGKFFRLSAFEWAVRHLDWTSQSKVTALWNVVTSVGTPCSSPWSRGFETIVAHAEIIVHGLLFSVLDKDKVTPESMFNGYGMQINVSNEGIDIVPSFFALKNR